MVVKGGSDTELRPRTKTLLEQLRRYGTTRLEGSGEKSPEQDLEGGLGLVEKLGYSPKACELFAEISFDYINVPEPVTNQHCLCAAIQISRSAYGRRDLIRIAPLHGVADGFRIVGLSIDSKTDPRARSVFLRFLALSFGCLDAGEVRKACAPLVSVAVLSTLASDERRDERLQSSTNARKAWRGWQKRSNAATPQTKSAIEAQRTWLSRVILQVLHAIFSGDADACSSMISETIGLLTILLSQFPTRRYSNLVVQDSLLFPAFNLLRSKEPKIPGYIDELVRLAHTTSRFEKVMESLETLSYFPFNDQDGIMITDNDFYNGQTQKMATLQRAAFNEFPEKLKIFALSNFASVSDPRDIRENLSVLNDEELSRLCALAHIRLQPDQSEILPQSLRREAVIEAFSSRFRSRGHVMKLVQAFRLTPSEEIFEMPELFEILNNLKPIPRYPLYSSQMLSAEDTHWRLLHVLCTRLFADVRGQVTRIVSRMQPQIQYPSGATKWSNAHGQALLIKPLINFNIGPPLIGAREPRYVSTDVPLDLGRCASENARDLWDSLRPGDMILLLAIKARHDKSTPFPSTQEPDFAGKVGIKYVRCAQLEETLDEAGKSLGADRSGAEDYRLGNRRTLRINLDCSSFHSDRQNMMKTDEDVYAQKCRNLKSTLLSGYGAVNAALPSPGNGPQTIQLASWSDRSETSMPNIKGVPGHREVRENYEFRPIFGAGELPKHQSGKDGPLRTRSPDGAIIALSPNQEQVVASCLHPGLTLLSGMTGTGKTTVLATAVDNLWRCFPNERVLVLGDTDSHIQKVLKSAADHGLSERKLVHLCDTAQEFGTSNTIQSYLDRRAELLALVDSLAQSMQKPGAYGNSCETAINFYVYHVKPIISQQQVASHGLFSAFLKHIGASEGTKFSVGDYLASLFEEIETLRTFEYIASMDERVKYVTARSSTVVGMTPQYALLQQQYLQSIRFSFETLVIDDASLLEDCELGFLLQTSSDPEKLKRIILAGDINQRPPTSSNPTLDMNSGFQNSTFAKLSQETETVFHLETQFSIRLSMVEDLKPRFQNLVCQGDASTKSLAANAGFLYASQIINVDDYQGQGESEPQPNYWQNLGEAEYAVAVYQYMRLLGYPADKVTILSPYVGQVALIQDILEARCSQYPFFGSPFVVTTVEDYQNRRNDYIILSLVRTSSGGMLNDLDSTIIGLTRGTLGLYVLGRAAIPQKLLSRHQLNGLCARPTKLMLVTGEMWPTKRKEDSQPEPAAAVAMESVEHLSQYVYQMTQKRISVHGNT